MILTEDQEIIIAMVGPAVLDEPPDGFVEEYLLRLGMLSRSGKSGAMGHMGVMQLLRDFRVDPEGKPRMLTVKDWNQVELDTKVICQGQRGLYRGQSGEGMLLVKLDGQRAQIEVPSSAVTLAESIVEGVDDEGFEPEEEPAAAKLTEPAKSGKGAKGKTQAEKKADALLDKWGEVDAGAPVSVKVGQSAVEGEFVDLEGDDTLVVLIDGKRQTVPAEDVSLSQ